MLTDFSQNPAGRRLRQTRYALGFGKRKLRQFADLVGEKAPEPKVAPNRNANSDNPYLQY